MEAYPPSRRQGLNDGYEVRENCQKTDNQDLCCMIPYRGIRCIPTLLWFGRKSYLVKIVDEMVLKQGLGHILIPEKRDLTRSNR